MQFNVAQLLQEPIGSTRSYVLDEAIPPLVDDEPGRITGQVHLLRTERTVLVTATLETSATCTCSRCLESYRQQVSVSLEEEFSPVTDINTDAALRLEDSRDIVFTIDENHILDLTEAVCQYIIISLPMKPLCRIECAGICPGCGTSRGIDHTCDREDTTADQRWSSLRSLLPEIRA